MTIPDRLQRRIQVPTPLVDLNRVRRNIGNMADNADTAGVVFRPHFKTHQCREIGRMFRKAGVDRIAVSSLKMAEYFAEDGWADITLAFPVNIRQLNGIAALSRTIRLNLIADHPDSIHAAANTVAHGTGMFIEIDADYGRTGVPWDRFDAIRKLVQQIQETPLAFMGLLTHAGQTYHANSREEIVRIHEQTIDHLHQIRNDLENHGISVPAVSIGDTPGCMTASAFDGVNEIRPGNFVFFDLIMQELGVCTENGPALAVACPVVGMYPDRGEVAVLGGAVHFSKEQIHTPDGPCYGMEIDLSESGFSHLRPSCRLVSLSQEHGIVRMPPDRIRQTRIGDLLTFVPVHSCLTADLYDHYLALDGSIIPRLNSARLRD